jgi:hypothetical protein
MPRAVNLIWLAAILSVLVLLGQTLGIYDMPMLHDFRAFRRHLVSIARSEHERGAGR